MNAIHAKHVLRLAAQLVAMLAIAFATAIFVHSRDDAQERRDIRDLSEKYEGVGNANLLAAYVGHVEISRAIQADRPGSARCAADLRASAEYDALKACLAQTRCATAIADLARSEAPELSTNAATPFRYYRQGAECNPDDASPSR